MNEQIEKLLKQANPTFNKSDIVGPWYTEDIEKFAELIVQECMKQIQQVREIKAGHAGPEYTQGFDDGMSVAISTIEEHFGVEE